MLQALKQCTMHLHSQGNPIDLNDIQGSIISDDYDKFCFSAYNDPNVSFDTSSFSSLGGNSTGDSSNTGPSTGPSTKHNEVHEFWKGIRRDTLAFTALKRDEDFTSWNDNTIIQATSQGVEDVLD